MENETVEKKSIKFTMPVSIYDIILANKRPYESNNDTLCRILLEYSQHIPIANEISQIKALLLERKESHVSKPTVECIPTKAPTKISNEQKIRNALKGTMNLYQIINATSIPLKECEFVLKSLVRQQIIEKIGDCYRQKQIK